MLVCPSGFSPPALEFQDFCPCILFHLLLLMNVLFIRRPLVVLFLTFSGPCIVSIFILIYFQKDAKLHSLFISGKLLSTYFGWYLHPSSGAHTNVFTVSGTCQTVTATCRYCGRVETGLSVVWELY